MRVRPTTRWIVMGVAAWCLLLLNGTVNGALAQSRRVELQFTPTARAQLAVWIESADGERFQTVRLTQAVSFRGIGNRPGATQMNSGYRWPYGRREGVLPIWAHRRVAKGGARFPRVIFNGRVSEGNASSAGSADEPNNTPDAYFCLSFMQENSDRDHLDAVSCASQFASNKGRYLTESDQQAGYAEPFQTDATTGLMAPLAVGSLYPPRRDLSGCSGPTCFDHANVGQYNADARAVMPEIDAVTMATPSDDVVQRIVFDVPESWPDGAYVAYVEINVEGDYNDFHNATAMPTPTNPAGSWDYWAGAFGYPYRGQPSVLYRVPISVIASGGTWNASTPTGYGALHGEDGEAHAMDETISDDPELAPGSGADRLRLDNNTRLTVHVPAWDACRRPNPPSSCGGECDPEDPTSCGPDLQCTNEGDCIGLCEGSDAGGSECGKQCDANDRGSCDTGLLCADDGTCVGACDLPGQPTAIGDLVVMRHPDKKLSHQYARLQFTVPDSLRGIARYEVRFSNEPIANLESFERALPAVQATAEAPELTLPVSGDIGDLVEAEFGGLLPQLRYYVGVRSFDSCNAPSEVAVGEFTTSETYFTTVTACFVATAAYGTPLANEVGVLRGFRDRYLMTHPIGRALVDAYYVVGPIAADVIRERAWLRAFVRAVLAPIVALLD